MLDKGEICMAVDNEGSVQLLPSSLNDLGWERAKGDLKQKAAEAQRKEQERTRARRWAVRGAKRRRRSAGLRRA